MGRAESARQGFEDDGDVIVGEVSQGVARGQGEVDAEYAKNKAIGVTGCWKNGTLVEDDHGSVHKYMEANGLLKKN